MVQRDSIQDIRPLTTTQEGVLYHVERDLEACDVYCEQFAFDLAQKVDVDALFGAFQALVRRHDVLRTVFRRARDGRALALVLKELPIAPRCEDSPLPREQAARLAAVADAAKRLRRPAFSVGQGPLLRVDLIDATSERPVLVVSFHHLVMDGWSFGTVLDELLELYAAARDRRPAQLPELPSMAEYWDWYQSRDLEPSLRYWDLALGGLRGPAGVLSNQKPTESIQAAQATEQLSISVEASLVSDLRRSAASVRATLGSALQASWGVTLARALGRDDVVFGTIHAGRPVHLAGVEQLVGLFINAVPVRVQIKSGESIGTLLQRVQHEALEREEHQFAPLADIQARSGIRPLVDHLLIVENYPLSQRVANTSAKLSSLELRPILEFARNDYALTLQLNFTAEGGIHAHIFHDTERLPRDHVDKLMTAWRAVLQEMSTTGLSSLALAKGAKERPAPEALVAPRGRTAPSTPTETCIAAIWSAVLGRADICLEDDFFQIGGHSLKAMQVFSRLRKELDVALKLRDLLATPRLGALAALVDQKLQKPAAATGESAIAPAQAAADGSYALSPAQLRLWTLQEMNGDNAAYNVSGAFLLKGPLDPKALERALGAVVSRHEALRTVFRLVGSEPRQFIVAADQVRLEHHAVPDLAAAEAIAAQTAQTPLAFHEHPPVRFQLLRLAAEEHVLVVALHHIIFDGWSVGIFLRELSLAYAGASEGLQPPAIQYKDYAAWLNAAASDGSLDGELSYWRKNLEHAPTAMALPHDLGLPLQRTYPARLVHTSLPSAIGRDLAALSQASGTTPFATCVALVCGFLHRLVGERDLVVGTPVAGRVRPELEASLGCYLNLLPLRIQIDPKAPFTQVLATAREQVARAFDHQLYPYDRLLSSLGIARGGARLPFMNVAVAHQTTATALPDFGKVTVTEWECPPGGSKFDLSVTVTGDFAAADSPFHIAFELDAELFSDEAATLIAARFREFIASAVRRAADLPLAHLGLLPTDEQRAVCIQANEPERSLAAGDEACSYPELFRRAAARHAHHVALRDGEICVNYMQLDTWSDCVARSLTRGGVDLKGQVIGVMAPRTSRTIAALLGVLKAGAAYTFLDPAYPDARITQILDDCQPIVLADRACLVHPSLKAARQLLDLDDALNFADSTALLPAPQANDLAYLTYTSGSTGRPKGVMTEHAQLCAHILAARELYAAANFEVVFAGTSFAFDMSLTELWMPLVMGKEIRLLASNLEVERYLGRHERIFLNLVPSVLRELCHHPDFARVAVVSTGAEPVPLELLASLTQDAQRIVRNCYGPTETTAFVTSQLCSAADTRVAIGRPLAGVEIFILSDEGAVQGLGMVGEIAVAGATVARGYWHRPEETAQRFIAHPFGGTQRCYLTGDVGRWREPGRLEILGRKDAQVKIRGHRIELDEVEAALRSHPDVEDVVAAARDGALAAYVVLAESWRHAGDPTSLREHVARVKPDYMLPSFFVALESMPTSVNGKLAREQLPDPKLHAMRCSSTLEPEDLSPLEKTVREVWQTVLGTATIASHDEYFALGGDSIKAIQIAARLRQAGFVCEVRDIFAQPTVARLAAHLASHTEESACQWAPAKAPDDAPLTPVQQWFFDEAAPSPATRRPFNQGVAIAYDRQIDPAQLEACLRQLIDRHPMLRARFYQKDGTWRQRIESTAHDILRVIQNPKLSLADAWRTLHASIDFEKDAVFRAACFVSPHETRILLAAHHLVIDHVSWRILLTELDDLLAGSKAPYHPSTAFTLWIDKAKERARALADSAESTYWSEVEQRCQIGGAESVFPRPHQGASRGAAVRARAQLDVETTRQLTSQAARAYRADARDMLLVALVRATARRGGHGVLSLMLEGHGRPLDAKDCDLSRTVGWFTAQFPLAAACEAPLDPSRQIKETKELLRSIPGDGIGYGLLKTFVPERALGHGAPPLALLNYLGELDAGSSLGAMRLLDTDAEPLLSPLAPMLHAVELTAAIEGGALWLELWGASEEIAGDIAKELRDLAAHCAAKSTSELTPADVDDHDVDLDGLAELEAEVARLVR